MIHRVNCVYEGVRTSRSPLMPTEVCRAPNFGKGVLYKAYSTLSTAKRLTRAAPAFSEGDFQLSICVQCSGNGDFVMPSCGTELTVPAIAKVVYCGHFYTRCMDQSEERQACVQGERIDHQELKASRKADCPPSGRTTVGITNRHQRNLSASKNTSHRSTRSTL